VATAPEVIAIAHYVEHHFGPEARDQLSRRIETHIDATQGLDAEARRHTYNTNGIAETQRNNLDVVFIVHWRRPGRKQIVAAPARRYCNRLGDPLWRVTAERVKIGFEVSLENQTAARRLCC
jgi:hypothetical protein